MGKFLSDYFSINRRYLRSINLERDLADVTALDGYILTDKSVEALKRILHGFSSEQLGIAWTLTGVYGTGKSSFAHFLACISAPEKDPLHRKAMEILQNLLAKDSFEVEKIKKYVPKKGLFRAVVTAQAEPLTNTIFRALRKGVELFWERDCSSKDNVLFKIFELESQIALEQRVDGNKILELLKDITEVTGTSILLIIDELGKCLEFAAQNHRLGDLYLLQQLSEFNKKAGAKIYLLGLLHQAFSEYSVYLSSKERNEWIKIQGRFEEIPFAESPGQMIRLIGQAINHLKASEFYQQLTKLAEEWRAILKGNPEIDDVSSHSIADAYPLHPLTALILPKLCIRYAQNDRSLFTFLTSNEPYSLRNFLSDTHFEPERYPYLKLHQVYDYFVESVGMNMASKPNLQRWLEVYEVIQDAKKLDTENLQVLKTIGVINLVTSMGNLRASRSLVALAMCDNPKDIKQKAYWEEIIESLMNRGFVSYRKQLDELRLWEGSDFDVEAKIAENLEKQQLAFAKLLGDAYPLKPQVAQRHSYQTGTLRCFERKYIDSSVNLSSLRCSNSSFDGFIGYWLEEEKPTSVPSHTADKKPLVIVCISKLDLLNTRVKELIALKELQKNSPELQTDGVARKEVKYRLFEAEKLFNDAIIQNFEASNQILVWIDGKCETLTSFTKFSARLSDLCDETYHKNFTLWNELINRRELTAQGAKARRELIEAMISNEVQPRLGLLGNGPEVSIYISTLEKTGIHRNEGGNLSFYSPTKKEVLSLWEAIEAFCLGAKEKPKSLGELYKKLEEPPYGIKQGIIPIFLAAVFLNHIDSLCIYRDGSFIPILGEEHFELLVKQPSRFSVKCFEIKGLRAQVFKELEDILRKTSKEPASRGVRNRTLLSVVKPLYVFAKKLPQYTVKTKSISLQAQSVISTLLAAQEPDELIFSALPKACGLEPISINEDDNEEKARIFRLKLVEVLREIQLAYEKLLTSCNNLIHHAFGIRLNKENLREDLRVRSSYLVDQCIEPILKRFLLAALETQTNNQDWLEALLMVIADKPVESWTDESLVNFEVKLKDISRRFINLEALRADKTSVNEGFEARRITITRPDGTDINQVVWIDNERKNQVESIVEKILKDESLKDSKLQLAVIAKLAERILSPNTNTGPFQKGSKNEQESSAHPRTIRRER